MFCVYFFHIFSDSCQTNYLNIYQTDLHEICSDGRTLAVDERPAVSFFMPQGTLSWQTIFVDCIFVTPDLRNDWLHWLHSFLASVLPRQSHFLSSYWTSLLLIRHMHHRVPFWDHYSSWPTSFPSQASPTFTISINSNTPMTPNCLFLYPHPTTCPISIAS